MERIQEDLEEIQSILGLPREDTCAGADDVSRCPGSYRRQNDDDKLKR
jgi:hypothetical protein